MDLLNYNEERFRVGLFLPAAWHPVRSLLNTAAGWAAGSRQELFPWSFLSQGKAWSRILEADCGLLLGNTVCSLKALCSLTACLCMCVCVCTCGRLWPAEW